MKKTFILIPLVALLAACGGAGSTKLSELQTDPKAQQKLLELPKEDREAVEAYMARHIWNGDLNYNLTFNEAIKKNKQEVADGQGDPEYERKIKTASDQISELDKSLQMFKLDVGRYPTSAEGLKALRARPANALGWNGPYYGNPYMDISDPWGNPYRYSNPGPNGGIEILSLGADNAPGGRGGNADVRNTQ